MSKTDYSIGYKKPPKANQFKPGQSGNPKGRPEGSKNLATDLMEELKQIIIVKESGEPLKITKQRALVKSLSAKALNGNVPAINTLLKLISQTQTSELLAIETPEVSENDKAILDAFLKNYIANNT